MAEEPGGVLASDGLTFFIGQEIAFAPSTGIGRTTATRQLLWLIDRLIAEHLPAAPATIALDDGTRIHLDHTGHRIVAWPR